MKVTQQDPIHEYPKIRHLSNTRNTLKERKLIIHFYLAKLFRFIPETFPSERKYAEGMSFRGKYRVP